MKQLSLKIDDDEYGRLESLSDVLGVEQQTGRPGKLPWTDLVRVMAAISQECAENWPVVLERARLRVHNGAE